MKRVLFVRRTYGFGGVETILLDWLSRIDYSRYEVFVSSPADVFSSTIAEAELPAKFVHLGEREIIRIYGRYDPEKGINDLVKGSFWRFFPVWLRFLSRINPNVVVFLEGDFFTSPLACVLAAFLVTKGNVSMTVHSPNKIQEPLRKTLTSHFGLPGFGLWWYRQVWWPLWPWRMRGRLSHRVLTATRTISNKIVDFYGYPSAKMGLVSHGVDTTRFQPSQAARIRSRREYGIPDDAFVVASTSRLSYEKNIDSVVSAFDTIAVRNPSVWLLMTGKGALRGEIENLIAKCQARERIKLLGHVDDICCVLQAADAYVLASSFEGCPIALMEAMAMGLICLMSRIPGPDEMIEHGTDGFLIQPSKAGVTAGLEDALALSPAQRERMGRSARGKILERYELEKAIEFAFEQLGIEPRKATSARTRASDVSQIEEVVR